MERQSTIITHADYAAASPVDRLRFLADQMQVVCPVGEAASRRASARTVWRWQEIVLDAIAQLDPVPVRERSEDDDLPF
jgi:hypothetical protein